MFDPQDPMGVLRIEGKSRASLVRTLGEKALSNINTLREIIWFDDRQDVDATIAHAIENEQGWDMEYRIRIGGGMFWYREKGVFPVIDSSKKLAVIFINDVSKFKNIESDLQSQLDVSKQRFDLKNEVFASLTHEIRTPMNGVLGMAQVLTKTKLSTEQGQYVSTIIESSKALISVINDILDISKIEAGKLELNPESVDIERLVYDVCQLLAARAFERNNELLIDFDSQMPKSLIVDGGRLRQILINFIGNAIKFTSDGHIFLRICCESISSEKGVFLFEIQDTGIGISEVALANLFSAFKQVDVAIANTYGGTGLGLHICKQLVSLMGGELGARSQLEEGSTFWFKLELPWTQAVDDIAFNLTDKQVVLVGQDEVSSCLAAQYLAVAGLKVRILTNAEDALALFSGKEMFDFLIVDKNSPGMDGIALTKLIKKNQNIPALLLTTTVDRVDAAQLRLSGVNAYLTKPVSGSLLRHAMSILSTTEDLTKEVIFIASQGDYVKNQRAKKSIKLKGHVLVADDVDINQRVVKAMLANVGVTTEFANNGQEAVDKCHKNHYDLIFMDCQMPIKNGYDATREIRSAENIKANIPIIALTANASETDRKKCFDVGMDDFLVKPFIDDALFAILEKWMGIQFDEPMEGDVISLMEEQAIDLVQFNKLKTLMKDDFNSFITSIAGKFEERLTLISHLLSDGKLNEINEAAHALKGLSGMVGANNVMENAIEVENLSKEHDFAKLSMQINELEEAITQALGVINELIDEDLDQQVVLFE